MLRYWRWELLQDNMNVSYLNAHFSLFNFQDASGAHINVSRNIPKSTERLITIKVG